MEYNIDDRKYYSQSYNVTVKAYIIRKEDFKVTKLPSRVKLRLLGDKKVDKPRIEIKEDDYFNDECNIREDYDPFFNKILILEIKFPNCADKADFTIDTDMVIRKIETTNVYDFVMSVNGEFQNFENDVNIYNEDKIHFSIERNNVENESKIILTGFDPNIILDERFDPESSLDEEVVEEKIIINENDENKNE